MAAFELTMVQSTGLTLRVTIQRLDTAEYWQPATETWAANPAFSARTISMPEGTAENAGSYVADIANLSLRGDPGEVRIRVHNAGSSNLVIAVFQGFIVDDKLVGVDVFPSTRATPADVNEQVTAVIDTDLLIPPLTAVPGSTPTLAQAVSWLYMLTRNKVTSDASRVVIYDAAGQPLFEQPITTEESRTIRDALRNVV